MFPIPVLTSVMGRSVCLTLAAKSAAKSVIESYHPHHQMKVDNQRLMKEVEQLSSVSQQTKMELNNAVDRIAQLKSALDSTRGEISRIVQQSVEQKFMEKEKVVDCELKPVQPRPAFQYPFVTKGSSILNFYRTMAQSRWNSSNSKPFPWKWLFGAYLVKNLVDKKNPPAVDVRIIVDDRRVHATKA